MATTSEELELLIQELHDINQDFSQAAGRLKRPEELNFEERDHLGKELRARFARWEDITQKIQHFLEQPTEANAKAAN